MRRAVLIPALGLLLVAAACAVVESPPGGPADDVPPRLVSFVPDSAAVNVGPLDRLEFTFSEKMNRTRAGGWLNLYPPRKIRKTSWHGAIRTEVRLEEPFPPDTVVVVEVAASMKDAHKVSGLIERRYPVATGGRIPGGSIAGSLALADSALADAVVELYPVPPDTIAWDKQDILRRVRCDKNGRFRLDWLPVPSGPYLLRAFADADLDLRIGEKEPRRLFPDTVRIAVGDSQVVLTALTLYPLDTPGSLFLEPRGPIPLADRFGTLTLAITTSDTGWTPAPAAYDSLAMGFLDSALADTLRNVKPGRNRVILFADLDRDSTFSIVPESLIADRRDTLLFACADRGADTTGYSLEPWRSLEPVTIEPGLLTRYPLEAAPFTITPWASPGPDSTAAAITDSLAVQSPDSTAAAAPDSAASEKEP